MTANEVEQQPTELLLLLFTDDEDDKQEEVGGGGGGPLGGGSLLDEDEEVSCVANGPLLAPLALLKPLATVVSMYLRFSGELSECCCW